MNYQSFWANQSYAIVGNSATKKFPMITYGKLKEQGKTIFPVDPSVRQIDGDQAYPDLDSLPDKVDAVVLELPKSAVEAWIEKTASAGIKNVWIHMNCETPEAISLAKEKGLNLFYGTCAVMYLTSGFSIHTFHGWINKKLGKY